MMKICHLQFVNALKSENLTTSTNPRGRLHLPRVRHGISSCNRAFVLWLSSGR